MPAIAVYQVTTAWLTHCYRRQASSHISIVFFQESRAKKRPDFRGIEPFLMLLFRSTAFEGQGYALAAADAQGGQAFLGVALDHFMQQGHQYAAA